MKKKLSKPTLKQYGMDGWREHLEYFVTCAQCDTIFLSNIKGEALCNGEVYEDCPYCSEKVN